MLWYDSFGGKNSIHHVIYKRKKLQTTLIKTQFKLLFVEKLNKHYFNYIVPVGWKFLIMYNKPKKLTTLKLYSTIYLFSIPIFLKPSFFSHDINTNQLFITLTYVNNLLPLYLILISKFNRMFINPFFFKIKFKGKGYYIYKNYRNTITPQFGYSHRLYIYSFYNHVKFLNKTSLVCFGLTTNRIINISKNILNWRCINIFTGRGVRFSKQIIYKKSGKVSSYR